MKLAPIILVFAGAITVLAAPRVPPFSEQAPTPVLEELQSRGCKLPRKTSKKNASIIISGEFLQPGQSDWAAVCLTNKGASLLVFPGGSREHVMVVTAAPAGSYQWSLRAIHPKEISALPGVGSLLGSRVVDHDGISSYIHSGDLSDPASCPCPFCCWAAPTVYYHLEDRWLVPYHMDIN